MWKELVQNEVWYTDNFINEELVNLTLDKIRQSEIKELDGNEQPHIISNSYYNYNHVKYNIHKDSDVVVAVINRLNEILSEVYKPILIQNINEKNVLHIFRNSCIAKCFC